MTISNEQVRVSYTGDGASTSFPIPYPFYLGTDITVMLGIAVQSSGYSITGGKDANGNPQAGVVIFSTPPASTVAVQFILDVPLTQLVNLVDGTEFPSATLNQVNDRAIQALLRHDDLLSRTILAPDGDVSPNLALPTASVRANTYPVFDTNGNLSVAQSLPSGTLSQATIGLFLYPRVSAETAAGVTPTNYAYAPGNIRRYGAMVDGLTDDSAAIRQGLDAVPSTGGRIYCDPPGTIMVKSVIYIPQRISGGYGTILDFTGCQINGNGGPVFESGTGQYSTVSKGGATNFGIGNETATTLHYGDRIIGATFSNCSIAIKLFNFVTGCELKNLKSTSTGVFVYVQRCFYLQWNNLMVNASGAQPAGTPFYDLYDNINTMTFDAVRASGGGAATGIGFRFNSSILGCTLSNISFENLTIGLDFIGEILGVLITGNYSENCTTSISLGSLSDALVIEGNYFNANTTVVTGNNWISGRWGLNHYDSSPNAVNLLGTGNLCEVYIPPRQYANSATTTWTSLPTGWTVSPGCVLKYSDYVYNGAIGFNASLAALSPYSQGGVSQKQYTGTLANGMAGNFPFCTLTNTATTITVVTKIPFSSLAGGLEFDLVMLDGVTTKAIAGRTFAGGVNVFRYDTTPGATVTVSNNGGFFQFVFGGFTAVNAVNYGEIRIT